MKPHWWQHLPEAGFNENVAALERCDKALHELDLHLRELRRERARVQREILADAQRDWSPRDIRQARRLADRPPA